VSEWAHVHSQAFTRLDASYKKQECYPSWTHGLTHSQAFTGLDVSYKKQECYPSRTHGLTQFFYGVSVAHPFSFFVLYFILLICLSSTCVVYAQCCIVHFVIAPTVFLSFIRSFYLRRSSAENLVERDFLIRILFQVYFDFA
jgi:hypothetical protein